MASSHRVQKLTIDNLLSEALQLPANSTSTANTKCCRCLVTGSCSSCSCKKAGRACLQCLPCSKGNCLNRPSCEQSAVSGVDTATVSQAVSAEGRPQSVTCPVCLDAIVDTTVDTEGQEALLCEGSCKRWLHRWCAGVHKEDYASLSSSAEAFVCRSCSLTLLLKQMKSLSQTVESLKVTVGSLQGSVASLQSEVLQLKEAGVTSVMASESASGSLTVAGKGNRDNLKKANLRKSKKTELDSP